ncbi:MAG: hypothetical protein KHX29_03755 [Prevotella buccalis]|nr:hypothetical protein [Hoylesella buccalis]
MMNTIKANEMTKFTEKHIIEFSDCDENQHLKLSSMVDLMMQVSEHQVSQKNAGSEDLLKQGIGWVVTQYHFEINNLPKPGDEVILSTEASGYNRFFEYRDFGISTADGEILVSVQSRWVMFDLKKRSLIPCDEELMQRFNVPLLKKQPFFARLRPQKEYSRKRRYRVRYDDLDTNHHLTNSHYFNWFIDMLDRDFLREHLVKTIDIKFDKEIAYGEEPFSCVVIKKEDAEIKTFHAIENSDGVEETVSEITWRQI